jgi:hypothetical protein
MEITKMDQKTATTVKAVFGSMGGRILGSKGAYHHNNPDHVTVFNSNVYILRPFIWFLERYKNQNAAELLISPNNFERIFGSILAQESEIEQNKEWLKFANNPEAYRHALEKVWYGDLDLTLEEDKLIILSRLLEASVFIIRETGGRFENDGNPNLQEVVYQVSSGGASSTETQVFDTRYYERNNKGQLIYKSLPSPSDEEIEKQKRKIQKSYKKKDFEIVDLKLHSLEDFDGDKEEYDAWNYFEVSRFFDNVSKDITPYHNYINFLKDHLQVDVSKDYLQYYITKEDSEALKTMFKYWIKIYDPFASEYRIEQTVAWTSFDVGPSYFQETPTWAHEGKLYRKKPKEESKDV